MAPHMALLAAAFSMALIQPAFGFSLSSGGLRLASPAAQRPLLAARQRRPRVGAFSLLASSDGGDGEAEDVLKKYPPLQPGETREEDGMVQITEVELLELAEKAGVKVKFGNGSGPPPQGSTRPPVEKVTERRVLKPLFDKLEPIFALPPVLRYPALLLLAGGAAAVFIPLLGTGSLRDIKGTPPPAPVVAEAAPVQAKQDGQAEVMGFKLPVIPAADDPSIAKSCATFPMSLTPTCTDPDIGSKGILKNLDKYKNWKAPEEVKKAPKTKGKAAAAPEVVAPVAVEQVEAVPE